MIKQLLGLLRFFSPGLPDLSEYRIPERPRRNVAVKENRSTKAQVADGKAMTEVVEPDGTIVTHIGKQAPKTALEVQIDGFDEAMLDFTVGVKWKKDQQRVLIMKWHWMQGRSAAMIATKHTDQDGNLERGYSERTAADFIKAFFEADDERERQGKPRIRAARESLVDQSQVVEW